MQSTSSSVERSSWIPAILAFVIATLPGCSLTPSYDRPDLPLPLLTGSASIDGDGPKLATLLSEEETDLLDGLDGSGQLKRLAMRALLHNRDYAIALLRVEQARAEFGVGKADRFPTIQATGQLERQQFNDRKLNEVYGQRYAAAGIGVGEFELDFFERVKALSEVSRHQYLATELGQHATRKALIAEVAQRYLLMRAASSRHESAKALLSHRQKQLLLAQRQVEAGEISREDLQAVGAAAAQAEQQAREAELQLAKASNALEQETGYEVPVQAHGYRQIAEDEPGNIGWLSNLSSSQLLERFDVQAAEEQLKASNASIGAARAAFFPSITLSTSAGIASEHLHDLFSNGTGTWLFAPQINIPLFDGGRNQANLDIANARKQISVANYEKTIQSAFRDMVDGLSERETLLLRIRSQSVLNQLAQEQASRRQEQAHRGDASQLDALASQIQAVQTEQALVETRLAIQLNILTLYRVLYGADASAIPS
ncbi:efflux transporter outer membrane subunit [Pseudomonas sp. BGr12]|uniref:efflux transporter outer membrane subunit n=1 Tax=Pseudomonas sp. BGr12 TaxID=2936269 RepID=UPI002559DE12|nr:efflux transporter outer membrane subunit [Pseudomonas sp. BJa5]MDL2426307.1 efflux transporter outer membrane subunit [Pseudomonas sp. BJa5]